MNTESAAILSGIVTCLMGVVWYWSERVRRVPLDEFGLEAVNLDAINLELKRRGMVDGSQADTDNQK